jgi:hypothetical protein
MNKKRAGLFLAVALGAAFMAARAQSGQTPSAEETKVVVGLVRDIACPLQNPKSTTTSYSKDCIVQCAKVGSPLGILTADGTTYLPVTSTMPDMGQDKLKPFIGEMVEARGKVSERNGGHAIEIKEIHKLPATTPDR